MKVSSSETVVSEEPELADELTEDEEQPALASTTESSGTSIAEKLRIPGAIALVLIGLYLVRTYRGRLAS